jgi:DNA end-binding protein Ku
VAERPIWRGHLRLALVSCPVALYGAHRESSNLHFHFINPETGNRVRTITLDAETDQELSRRDLARGYEFEKDRYVVLDDADFDEARIESSSMMTVEKFVERDAIDPVYFNTPYYMAPDGEAGQDVYVVLRDAIAKTGRVALSRVVISRRERAVAIMPMEKGLIAHTLYEAREIASAKSYFAGVPSAKPDAEMVKLAEMLIDRQTKPFDPADMEDRYESRLRAVIEAKLKGVQPKIAAEEPAESNVIDLMSALKKSLGQDDGKKKPAAAPVRRAVKRATSK